MPHHVYANNNEICSKSSDGTSTMAIDVCFSPGAPMPGIPVTYVNTCKASDITRGSRTVSIKGKEICLEDQSYFAKSYGDEPATQAMKRGVVSNSIQGKCRFVSWSPNVMVEGLAVTRHLDLVTHNHNSPANTPPTYFMSLANNPASCTSDRRAIEKYCRPETDEDEGKKKKRLKKQGKISKSIKKITSSIDELGKRTAFYTKKAGVSATDGNAWMDDHCGGLWIKPYGELPPGTAEKLEETLNALKNDKWGLFWNTLGDLKETAIEVAGEAAKSKLTWLAVRSGGKMALGLLGIETGVVTAAMTAWTVADVLSTAADLAVMIGPQGAAIKAALESIKDLDENVARILESYKTAPHKALADAQSLIAQINPCLRARKCMLVPYGNTSGHRGKGSAVTQANHGNGCCPGQTGHHVMPGAMFRNANCGYTNATHKAAPTICMEGTTNDPSIGSHGMAHDNLRKSMEKYREKHGDAISYNKAQDQALDAVQKAGALHCNRQCLKAQLDAFYKECNKGDVPNLAAASGMGGAQPQPEPYIDMPSTDNE